MLEHLSAKTRRGWSSPPVEYTAVRLPFFVGWLKADLGGACT